MSGPLSGRWYLTGTRNSHRNTPGKWRVETLIKESQVAVTCTPSKQGYIEQKFLHPGLHITAMGADLPDKQEIRSDVFQKTDLIACDIRSQSFSVGELYNAQKEGIDIDPSSVLELGEIISGQASGRSHPDQITICDLSGTGVQDTAIADLALKLAIERGLGTPIEG